MHDIRALEQLLGRKLDLRQYGAYRDPKDLPPEVVEEIRRVPELHDAIQLVRFFTGLSLSESMMLAQRLKDGLPPAVGPGAIYVDVNLKDHLRLSFAGLLSKLQCTAEELQRYPISIGGYPAVPQPAPKERYRRGALYHEGAQLEPIGDPLIGFRRWIAWRVAKCVLARGKRMEELNSVEEVATVLEERMQEWSKDAHIAVQGLLQECRDPHEERPWGYRAEDGAYGKGVA